MPRQYTLLGRPIPPCTNHRLTTIWFGLCLLAFMAILILHSSISVSPGQYPSNYPKIAITKITDPFSNSFFNPFRRPSHPPPRQKSDTYDGASWWADWKWLAVPFSSSVTLDEDRALLPPLRDRPNVYCYYDATIKKPKEEKDAEVALLLTWRRAWWAQGFRPIILSASEAMNNPKYRELQRLEMTPELKTDLLRWLAWDAMGGGLLAQYTLLPTGPSEDLFLSYLRRGNYPQLTRWEDLKSGLIAGTQTEVDKAMRSIMKMRPLALTEHKTMIAALWDDHFRVDTSHGSSLAYYSSEVIRESYAKVGEDIIASRANGLGALNRLINSHLQMAWQNRFPDGIQVLKPLPEHTTVMVSGALQLAHRLASCPDSPMAGSCPPQLPRCTPCIADSPSMSITTPSQYRNSSGAYAIGTVPHPWTLASVHNLRQTLDIAWIRRESPRDPWLAALTQELLGDGDSVTGGRRVMCFKRAVADEHADAHALWLTAEAALPNDLDWYFGFAIPKPPAAYTGPDDRGPAKESIPPPKPSESQKRKDEGALHVVVAEGVTATPSPEDALAQEPALLDRAKRIVALTKLTPETRLRASLEAWNMADTEAWKFARAHLARRSMERAEWEAREAWYTSGAGTEKGRDAWSQWGD